MSDSDSEIDMNTPSDIVNAATNATNNLLPQKSRAKYENAYKDFLDWTMEKATTSMSKNVLLSYFEELSKKFSSATVPFISVEEPSIHTALQKIRFLSLTAEQFAEGPARSGLLTKDEYLAVLMNIASRDSPVPMPPGFSACRERRQTRNDSNQCFEAGSLDHTIHALKCGDPSQVKSAARAAYNILRILGDIQPALDKGILDALVPALTEGDVDFTPKLLNGYLSVNQFPWDRNRCKQYAAWAINNLCLFGSTSQLSVLAASAALEPYCRLLTADRHTWYPVLQGLTRLLEKVEENTKVALLLKLREIGVPQLLMAVQRDGDEDDRKYANNLMRTGFHNVE